MAVVSTKIGHVEPIPTESLVGKHDRPNEETKDISSWFTTETMTIDFGDDTGRPSPYFSLKREYIVQFLQNGWTIKKIHSTSYGGDWSRGTDTDQTHTLEKTGESESSSSSTTGGSTSSSTTWTPVMTNQHVTEEGEQYWYAAQRIEMQRRRMQPENVLSDIINTYVRQYNAGVTNEDGRFNDVVALYGVMLNHTETELNSMLSNALDVTKLFDTYYSSIMLTNTAAHNAAVTMWHDMQNEGVREITLKYDTLIAQTRAKMIGQGTYNGTVWPTVEAGILREKAAAIEKAKYEVRQIAVDSNVKVMEAKGDVMTQLVNAKNAISSAIDQRKITVIELRNTVLKNMLDFLGSREDVYPQLLDISSVASQIGFSIGASGNAV